MSLHPFDEDALCPKCASLLVLVRYVRPGNAYVCTVLQCGPADVANEVPCVGGATCEMVHIEWAINEHMHRICDRCGHAWPEAVLPHRWPKMSGEATPGVPLPPACGAPPATLSGGAAAESSGADLSSRTSSDPGAVTEQRPSRADAVTASGPPTEESRP